MAGKKKAQAELGIEGAGVAPVVIPEVEAAADKYIKIKDARCKISPKEIAAKGELIDVIHKNREKLGQNAAGETIYRYDDLVIKLIPGPEKLSIKEAREDGGTDAE